MCCRGKSNLKDCSNKTAIKHNVNLSPFGRGLSDFHFVSFPSTSLFPMLFQTDQRDWLNETTNDTICSIFKDWQLFRHNAGHLAILKF